MNEPQAAITSGEITEQLERLFKANESLDAAVKAHEKRIDAILKPTDAKPAKELVNGMNTELGKRLAEIASRLEETRARFDDVRSRVAL